MTEYRGRLGQVGRVAIVVSGYHERITRKLLDGALTTCRNAGIPESGIDVVWVPGAFELGAVASALARRGSHAVLVALGAVVRGETPHFDYVAGETSRVLADVARAVPCGFGLLTVDTMEQAEARAGGALGNKGAEAAEAALRTADVLAQIGSG
ncbi:MAG: 6,7-dimethyl-8-ribityllumazine synthase [Gemmatimonadetes bacterium]|nr:6,7-dimethyl-8-ribityllumazine synthase [Gemmatimonadota bacterium]